MRSSSVSVRCALSIALVALVSCAHPKVVSVQDPLVTLQGVVALASASPLEATIVLADAGGRVCTLTSPSFEYELRSLAGQGVRVTGRLLGKTAGGPEFLVENYEILPVRGYVPIVGTLESRGGLVLVQAGSGHQYDLGGSLAETLRNFVGYKVWVSGPTVSVPEPKANAASGMTVESYGILAPPGAMNRTP
jgi:hypothetical protein